MKYLVYFLSTLFVSQLSANETPLNIYMWEDTLSPRVKQDWEKKTNIPLNLSHFDNDDERSLLMMKSIQLPFDLIILDNVSAQLFGKKGIFEDLSHLKNIKHNQEKWNSACGKYAVPYFWGTVGIAYQNSKVAPPKTWSEFVTPPKELYGKIGMIEDSIESFLPVLYSLDLSPITAKQNDLQKAYSKMLEFNDKTLTYEYILSYIRSQEKAENMLMALAYSGDQYSLNRFYGQNKWSFTIPEGQLFIWVDCLALNTGAQNKQEAYRFLDYLMDPSVAAKNAIDIKAATPNATAIKLLPEWYLNDASLFPSEERVRNAQIDSLLSSENISLRTKIINKILKRHEAKH